VRLLQSLTGSLSGGSEIQLRRLPSLWCSSGDEDVSARCTRAREMRGCKGGIKTRSERTVDRRRSRSPVAVRRFWTCSAWRRWLGFRGGKQVRSKGVYKERLAWVRGRVFATKSERRSGRSRQVRRVHLGSSGRDDKRGKVVSG
jgi:hypothetical protein